MSSYFKKDNLSNPIKLNGQIVNFERSGQNNGVRRVEDGETELLAALNDFADQRKMGVRRISPENYESLKKKPGRIMTPPPSLPPVRVFDRESALPKGSRTPPKPSATPSVAAAAGKPAAPATPPGPSAALKEMLAQQRRVEALTPPPTPPATPPVTIPPVDGPKTKVKRVKKADVEPPAATETL